MVQYKFIAVMLCGYLLLSGFLSAITAETPLLPALPKSTSLQTVIIGNTLLAKNQVPTPFIFLINTKKLVVTVNSSFGEIYRFIYDRNYTVKIYSSEMLLINLFTLNIPKPSKMSFTGDNLFIWLLFSVIGVFIIYDWKIKDHL